MGFSGHPIVGTWRLTSFTEENLETGGVSYPFGVGARAFVIYGQRICRDDLLGGRSQAADRGPGDRAGSAPTLPQPDRLAGRYELVGNKLIYRPEISWNESWNGTTQEREFQVDEDRLEVKSAPAVSTLTGARTVFSLVWQRAT